MARWSKAWVLAGAGLALCAGAVGLQQDEGPILSAEGHAGG